MRSIFYAFTISLIVLSCSSDDNAGTPSNDQILNNATSQLCPGLVGPSAVYWDQAHGILGGLSQVPLLSNPGQQFIHSQYPPVNFTMPAGYTAQEISGIHTVGVNVFRQDDQVIWRYLPNAANFGPSISALDVIANEINNLLGFYGFNGAPTVICSEQSQMPQGNFFVDSQSRLIQFGNRTAQVNVLVNTFGQGPGSQGISVRMVTGTTAEYEQLVSSVFLPLDWQLLVVDENVRDTDADGTPDFQDAFPFDPTRQ